MKKFLTVLLVIAVMFTFSFGSAFAYTDDQKAGVVETYEQATAKITKAYDDAVKELQTVRDTAKKAAADDETKAAYDAAYDEVVLAVNGLRNKALQALNTAIGTIGTVSDVQGYVFDKSTAGSVESGYVDLEACIDLIDLADIDTTAYPAWGGSDFDSTYVTNMAGELAFDKALAETKTAVANYNVAKFVKDDKVTHTSGVTKSSYEWATFAQTEALAYLNSLKYSAGVTTAATVKAVYKIENAGTMGETETGSFVDGSANYPAFAALKTESVVTTDKAKIEYVKSKALAVVKAKIGSEKAAALEVQNKILFAQSIASKPNQAAIDAANDEIARINKEYDALEEVMVYRIENAEYRVEADAVKVYYDDAAFNGILNSANKIGQFTNGVLDVSDLFAANPTLALTVGADKNNTGAAVTILDKIAELKDEAELLKATVAVDGAAALEVDKALKDAIDEAYMTGTADLSVAQSDTIVHINAHKLLGTACTEYHVSANAKVTVNGKEYDTVANWDTDSYSYANEDVVWGIIDDAEAAIKAAATVEEANAAFVAAYEKYDAVITIAEQKELFSYRGALYGKDKAANAELNAYIDYKVSLLDEAPAADTASAIKTHFNTTAVSGMTDDQFNDSYFGEVVDEASLQAAIADVKATVDALKTKAALKDEAAALVKEENAVKRPVTPEQKAEVFALYDKITDYEDYCGMVNYTAGATVVGSSKTMLQGDITTIAKAEKKNLDAMKKALGDVNKLTLAQKDAVDAFEDAQDAYNDLYGVDGTYSFADGTDYTGADAYVAKIWQLRLTAVRKLIAVLPTYPTAAQVSEATTALEELGFKGICEIGDTYLTKLDKFAQDSDLATIKAVETLKITASSSAKKGSITVKWTVKGDTSAVEGYEIWKSTKHSSGYKKAFTTTKKSYKNTKGLKKGTRYYYKVRAFAHVDGKKVTSDWSNKARRIAK